MVLWDGVEGQPPPHLPLFDTNYAVGDLEGEALSDLPTV
jgi:hypothetical protein